MDEERYAVRPFVDADFEEYTAMHNRMFPDYPISVEVFRNEWASLRLGPEPPFRIVVTERASGAMVASGGLVRNPREDDPHRPWAFLDVDPGHRHRGIGTYLWDAVRVEAERRGATGLRARCRAEPPEFFEFLRRRGFVERRRSWISELDLSRARLDGADAAEAALRAQGIEFTTLAAEGADSPGVLHRVHELSSATGIDVPRLGQYTPTSFAEFRQLDLAGEGFDPAGWMLAKVKDADVGVSYGFRNLADPTRFEQAYTATQREYRGRGVAWVLKARLIRYAAAHGFERISTSNDSLNEPMWALNQRLGFERSSVRLAAECEFGPPR